MHECVKECLKPLMAPIKSCQGDDGILAINAYGEILRLLCENGQRLKGTNTKDLVVCGFNYKVVLE